MQKGKTLFDVKNNKKGESVRDEEGLFEKASDMKKKRFWKVIYC